MFFDNKLAASERDLRFAVTEFACETPASFLFISFFA
jgi:hypothetical protein